jgi:hypothetical protein
MAITSAEFIITARGDLLIWDGFWVQRTPGMKFTFFHNDTLQN